MVLAMEAKKGRQQGAAPAIADKMLPAPPTLVRDSFTGVDLKVDYIKVTINSVPRYGINDLRRAGSL